jgi:CRISPR/Cas system-associated exonuclease Cas4 (RecB family)
MSDKAVINGVLQHVSPSQINTYELCARRWYFDKVMGLRAEETETQTSGKGIHKELEDYYRKGELPTSPSALKLINEAHLAPLDAAGAIRTEAPLVQAGRDPLLAAGVPVVGFIDVLDLRQLPDRATVIDYKTTVDLKYAKSKKALERDPQLTIYSQWAFHTYPEISGVSGKFIYILKPRVGQESTFQPAYKPVDVPVRTQAQVSEVFEQRVVPVVAKIQKCASVADPKDVEYNEGACWAFNKRCPYYSECQALNAGKPPADPWAIFESETNTVTDPNTTAHMYGELSNTATPAVNPPVSSELHLFIDCAPCKPHTGYTRLEDLIAARAAPICAAASVKLKKEVMDVREIPFGEGTAALVAAFKKSPPVGIVVATSVGLSAIVLEGALVPAASVVVRTLG